ncbi:MAG: hypothetical protein ACP5R0_03395 [Thermoplasmata archaeon]
MEKLSIPIFYMDRKTIKGFRNVDEFIDNVKDSEIYIIDSPTFRGRDINFKILSRLSAIYGVWYDGNLRWKDDVSDILLSGAKIAVLSGKKINDDFISKILSITENVALKSDDEELLLKFRGMGGRIAITNIFLDGLALYRIDGGRLVQL